MSLALVVQERSLSNVMGGIEDKTLMIKGNKDRRKQ